MLIEFGPRTQSKIETLKRHARLAGSAILLATVLASCGGDDNTTQAEATSTTSTAPAVASGSGTQTSEAEGVTYIEIAQAGGGIDIFALDTFKDGVIRDGEKVAHLPVSEEVKVKCVEYAPAEAAPSAAPSGKNEAPFYRIASPEEYIGLAAANAFWNVDPDAGIPFDRQPAVDPAVPECT